KNATTENQKFVQALEGNTFKEFQQLQPDADLRVFDMDFEQDQRKVLIITHFPVDLLNRYKFSRLVLLETHTGAMKPHTLWYTKLYNGKELNMIPFDRMTVQLFGDGNLFTDRKSTRLNSSHVKISYAVFCLKKKKSLLMRV